MSKICFPHSEIWLGGIYASLTVDHAMTSGADRVISGLLSHTEDILPDYSIVPEWNTSRKASVLFSHRGCVRSCGFCAVPKLEGKPFQPRKTNSIRHLIWSGHKRVVLWDNNILGESHWQDLVEELKELALEVDFNQGLDARFINEDVAHSLRGLKMPFIRLAYDSPGMGNSVKRAIELLQQMGFRQREIVSYVLFNYKDTPDDLFRRVRDLLEWGATAYPMRYQPLDGLYAFEKDSYISSEWTAEQLDMVAQARRVIGYGGAFPPYEGLVKKFLKARSFEEAFGLWPQHRNHISSGNRSAVITEMAEDHEWPLVKK
jgi:hypothetical protein